MFARGTGVLIAWLALATLALVVVTALVISAFGIAANGDHPGGFFENAWQSLLRAMDPGTMGGDRGWGFRIVALAVTIGGILIVSILIGLVTSGIENRLAELRKGRSQVIEHGHVVVLGWSPKLFPVISELAVANANQRDGCIVILAPRDKSEMEDELAAQLGDLGPTRLVCRTGNPSVLGDLELVSVDTAKSVIVLAPDGSAPVSDAMVIRSVLALLQTAHGTEVPVIAELTDSRNARALQAATAGRIRTLVSSEIVARVTAQVCREPGASAVYQELLDFDGDELYFEDVPALAGATFGAALTAFEDASIVGLRHPDGTVELAPSMTTTIAPGSAVLAIAEDDDRVVFTGFQDVEPRPSWTGAVTPERPSAHILVLGWNHFGPFVLHELDGNVPPGSKVCIAVHPDRPEAATASKITALEHTTVSVEVADVTEPGVLARLLALEAWDHVILLCYRENCDADEADAHALMTLLALRQELSAREALDGPGATPSVVAELRDVRDVALAGITRPDDLIVSERLTSLVIAQLAEAPALDTVFGDLFAAGGPQVRLQPAANYVPVGVASTYAEIVAAGRETDEIVIGYRRNSAGEAPVVNPPKHTALVLESTDEVIVITRSAVAAPASASAPAPEPNRVPVPST
jgi:voltage-gated potassium channel Kch